MSRDRIDRVLVARGLVKSRARAQALIEAGKVSVGGTIVDKASTFIAADAPLSLLPEPGYVSRGGLKLEAALRDLGVSVQDLCVADIGASTGGFTDCVLAHGARRVYAIDVGHGQLHPSLRDDPRVVSMEGVNARALTREDLAEPVDLVLVDASFISLLKLLPALVTLLSPSGTLLLLVKPQFEVGPKNVGKRGVVRDDALRQAALLQVISCAETLGLVARGSAESHLPGPEGNREIFVWLSRSSERSEIPVP